MKRIAVINDLSGFGRCSLTASIPVISAMGHEACPFPTAILSNQTGYSEYYCDDFTDRMNFFSEKWKKLCPVFDGIFTGYIANEKQIDFIINFIENFSNDDTVILVDPVMGDDGKLYSSYNEKMCEKMKKLTDKATVITPNLTELCILSGEDYNEICKNDSSALLEKVEEMSKKILNGTDKTVITTGVPLSNGNEELLACCAFYCNLFNTVTVPKIGGSFSGTGDLFSAVVCSSAVSGLLPVAAMIKAMEFISKSIEETVKHPYDRNDGIDFQKFLKTL